MQRDSDIVDSGNPRLVLYCVKRSVSKSVIGVAMGGAKRAMPPKFLEKYGDFVLWEAFFPTK